MPDGVLELAVLVTLEDCVIDLEEVFFTEDTDLDDVLLVEVDLRVCEE
jgi:hypothetical protein